MIKMPCLNEEKNEKDQWNDTIINTVSQKRIGSGGQEFEVPAEENECGNVPAHDEHSNGNAYDRKTYGAYIPEVFRRQVKRIGTKIFHEHPIDNTKKNKPE